MTDLTTAPSTARDLAAAAARRAHGAGARDPRRVSTANRITYSPKVFIPLTMLCRDKCGYCTFAKAPAHIDSPYLTPDEVLVDRDVPAQGRLPRGVVHAGRTSRVALPRGRRPGSPSTATRRRSTTSSRWQRWCSTRRACFPTRTPARSVADELAHAASRLTVAGHDDRVAQRRSRLPSRFARQDTRATPGHARIRGRARHPVHHGHPRRHRRDARSTASQALEAIADVASAPRARAGSHRAELPAQARHRDAPRARRARPTTTSTRSRWPASSCPPTSTCRRRRTCPTTSACCSTPASTTGAASPR